MRCLILSDLHFRDKRLNSRFDNPIESIQLKLEDLFEKVKPIDMIIFLGDLLHERNPQASTILTFQKFLNSVVPTRNIYSLIGNHDLLLNENESTLDVLTNITILKEPITFDRVRFIPVNYTDDFVENTDTEHFNVLLSHKM
ncbi:MAG: metallophosphoesterase, partial [Sulfolobaceae archaeon]